MKDQDHSKIFFVYFWKKYNNGNNYIAASDDGRCAFVAIKLACGLLKNEAWFTKDLVPLFEHRCAENGTKLSEKGVQSWKIILEFIKFGNTFVESPTKQIYSNGFKKNFQQGALNDTSELREILLSVPKGVYLCVGFNRQHVGHAFIVHWDENSWVASDEDNSSKSLSGYLDSWWFGGYFLRRIAIFHLVK